MRIGIFLIAIFAIPTCAICENPLAPKTKGQVQQSEQFNVPEVIPVRVALASKANSQVDKSAPKTEINRDAVAPGEECEPWMYRVMIAGSPSSVELRSQAMSMGYLESGGIRISESTSRVIQNEVASFEVIGKWYATKLGATKLSQVLENLNEPTVATPAFRPATPLAIPMTTNLTYRFTPTAKQISILHIDENDDIVAISLLGTASETSIEVIRRFTKPSGAEDAVQVAY